jgi:hypothetical protein
MAEWQRHPAEVQLPFVPSSDTPSCDNTVSGGVDHLVRMRWGNTVTGEGLAPIDWDPFSGFVTMRFPEAFLTVPGQSGGPTPLYQGGIWIMGRSTADGRYYIINRYPANFRGPPFGETATVHPAEVLELGPTQAKTRAALKPMSQVGFFDPGDYRVGCEIELRIFDTTSEAAVRAHLGIDSSAGQANMPWYGKHLTPLLSYPIVVGTPPVSVTRREAPAPEPEPALRGEVLVGAGSFGAS